MNYVLFNLACIMSVGYFFRLNELPLYVIRRMPYEKF